MVILLSIIIYYIYMVLNYAHAPTIHSSKEGSELLGCTGAAVDIADFTGLPAPIEAALRADSKSRTL